MSKVIIGCMLITLILFQLYVVSAQIETNLQDNVKINNNISVDISANSSACTSKVYDNIGSVFFSNSSLSFTIPQELNTKKGEYLIKINCSDGSVYTKSYFLTNSGLGKSGDNFTAIIYLLFIVASVGLFYTFFTTLINVATQEETVYAVLLSWGFYILTMIVNYLGKEYLLRTFVEDLSGTFLTITVWTNGVLPVVALILTIFIKGTQKKRPVSVQELSGFRMVRNG